VERGRKRFDGWLAGICASRVCNGMAFMTYAAYDFAADARGYAGPLAGLHAGLSRTTTEYAATVPCDSPFLPADLVDRLRAALVARGAALAVARTFDQPHPVFCLVRRDVLPHLSAFLQGGGRKIDAWYASLDVVDVAFDDEADAFRNINTAGELAAAAHARPRG